MSKRPPSAPRTTSSAKLTPLSRPARPLGSDERNERDEDPVAAAVAATVRSPPKKYPRLQTLTSLAQEHVLAMHSGEFVQRSRLRWQLDPLRPDYESDAAHARRVSRESAALVVQSAWRCSATVRLRKRLVRAVWQQQAEMAAWLARDRQDLCVVIETLQRTDTRPLIAAQNCIRRLRREDSRLLTLRSAYTLLPRFRLATWLCFHLIIRCRSRFLRRPAPAILQTVHTPVLKTCRLWTLLWREIVKAAMSSIQSLARKYLARCTYWELVQVHRKTQAATRLQTVYRAWIAKRLVRRLRRRRAAVRLQCWCRCIISKQRVKRMRTNRIAVDFFTATKVQAVEHASHVVINHAALQIQRTFRGRRARGQFRVLVGRHQLQQLYKNPSRGYRLFENGEYLLAAVYLERCFRQGIFQDESDHKRRLQWCSHPQRVIPTGTNALHSCTTLDSVAGNFRRANRCCSPPAAALSRDESTLPPGIERLRFWLVFALSHWFSFHSNGDTLHLKQARLGFEAYVHDSAIQGRVMPTSLTTAARLEDIGVYARVSLAQCMYLSSGLRQSKTQETELALSLCIEVLDEMDMLATTTASQTARDLTLWRGQLLMATAALYLREREYESGLTYVQKLVASCQGGDYAGFSDLDLHFLTGLLLLYCPGISSEAEVWVQRCYQAIELWPGVGFYHRPMSSRGAIERLEDKPPGSFLLHHEEQTHADQTSSVKLLLKVKLSSEPCRISSLRIHSNDGLYHTKKLQGIYHFALHELVKQLPLAAGIEWTRGIRRDVHVPPLQKKLTPDEMCRVKRRTLLLSWEQWDWRLSSAPTRRNDCWGALCQLFAVRLEASGAHEMACFVARDGLVTSRDRALRAELFFSVGRAAANLQRHVEAALAMQQAGIESVRLPKAFNRNYLAIQRAVSRAGTYRHSFSHQLERVGKIERMAIKAWSFDSCSSLLRGHPFCEALLLQRIQDESINENVVDKFFLRSLVRAHMKAYLANGYFETKHVELALAGIVRLSDRYQHTSNAVGHLDGLVAYSSHITAIGRIGGVSASSATLSVDRVLLSWQHIPFQVAFEIAEILYRWPAMTCNNVINVLESLYGRLRSVKPRNWAFTAFEELLLIRLVFLYSQESVAHSSNASVAAYARRAVDLMDELIALRTLRALGPHFRVSVKQIRWPGASIRFPINFSLEELIFVRGFLWERLSELSNDKLAYSNAWSDYDELHRKLLGVLTAENEKERKTRQLQRKLTGVRVFAGETMDVEVRDMLHNRPFACVECEKTQVSTLTPATWMNQWSPSWSEYLEVAVRSSKARLTVAVMNRSTRLRQQALKGGGDLILGYVQLHMEDLLSNGTSVKQPQWYNLVCQDDVRGLTSGKRPRIRLGFQILMRSIVSESANTSRHRRREVRGNWDLAEIKACLHGDLERFVKTPWIWRWFAQRWEEDKQFSIAAWFLQRAISTNTTAMVTSTAAIEHAMDLERLAACYRATMGSAWASHAKPLLEEAVMIYQGMLESGDSSVTAPQKRLSAMSKLLEPGNLSEWPLASELAKQTPASSHWIAMRRRDGSVYYFNEDTWERFQSVESEPHIREPLEWEDDEGIVVSSYDPLQPRRVVVMSAEMKSRVAQHCKLQRRLHDLDPGQWVAVFNPRKHVMQFLSLADNQNGGAPTVGTTDQPSTYAMVADESTMYHVLVVQDAFRAYQRRRRRQRRLRGLLRSAYGLVCEQHAAQRRICERAETERKRQLNCLHVFIEKASRLRAMDLLTSDPFVVVEFTDRDGDIVVKGQTSVKMNTLSPQWHEDFRLHYTFADHERRYARQQREPMLRFRVYDRDFVKSLARDEVEADDRNEAEGIKDSSTGDFIGLATAAIDPLVHGKCVTADLTLHGEDIHESPRSYGTLTVTVQWVHDPEHELTHQRRNAVKPMLLVRPRKRTRPKPVLLGQWKEEFVRVTHAHCLLISGMGDVAVILDQLVRLFKRWRLAQTSGKTADEAKLMEQRLHAAVAAPQPFHAKQIALFTSAESAEAAVDSLVRSIREPISELIESCEKDVMAEYQATWESATTSIRDATLPRGNLESFKDEEEFAHGIAQLLTLRPTIESWRREVLVLIKAFFDPPYPSWEQLEEEKMILQRFEKIENFMQEALEEPRPATATKQTQLAPVPDRAAVVAPQTPTSGSRVVANPNVAITKRMERIERERRKAKKK